MSRPSRVSPRPSRACSAAAGARRRRLPDRQAYSPQTGFDRARLPLGTTGTVLAEFFHVLDRSKRDHNSAWQLLRSGAITVIALDNADLPDLQSLMKRYRDRQMDFADATLVHAGSRLKLADILTIDHDDFETNRMVGRRKFLILPERGAVTR